MISGLLNGLLALTFVGNMSVPFCEKEEANSSPVHETETGGNLTPIDGGGGTTFHDNEPADNSISGATEINADCAVIGTLYDKKMESGGNYEADHDFYRFSLQDSQKMTFSFKGSSSYRMRLLRYDGKSGTFLTEYAFSSAAHFYELTPATYYLDVYPQSKEDMSRRKYEITIGSTHDVNNADIDIRPLKKQGYRIFLWESERRPYNFDAWGEDKQRLRTFEKYELFPEYNKDEGYVDPIFQNDKAYLHSRLFITTVEDAHGLSSLVDNFYTACKEKIEKDEIKNARIKAFQEGSECALALIPFDKIPVIGTIAAITKDMVSLAVDSVSFISTLRFLAKPEFPELAMLDDAYSLGSLKEAGSLFDESYEREDRMVMLDKYFYLKHSTEGSSIYTHIGITDVYTTCSPGKAGVNVSGKHYVTPDGKITAKQTISSNDSEGSYGSVHCFKSAKDFENYIGFKGEI